MKEKVIVGKDKKEKEVERRERKIFDRDKKESNNGHDQKERRIIVKREKIKRYG